MNLVVDMQYGDEIQDTRGLPDTAQIEQWIKAALDDSMDGAQLTVRIVGLQESRELNETYRGMQGPTNVLSFPFEQPQWMQPPLLGDLVICADLVTQEAREQGKSEESHWAHLVIHGVLHLQGFDHETAEEAARMEGREQRIMARLGYPDPYADNLAV